MLRYTLPIISAGLVALSFDVAYGCPANPPNDFTDWLEGEIPTGPVGSSAEAEVHVNGLVAMGSAAGDSCGAAVHLPEGLTVVDVSVVHAETGEPVGFEGFRVDPLTTRGFCGSRGNCTGFVSKVGERGLEADAPLTMIFSVTFDRMESTRDTADMAAKFSREGIFILGGADEMGLPHHHLSVFRAPQMRVSLAER